MISNHFYLSLDLIVNFYYLLERKQNIEEEEEKSDKYLIILSLLASCMTLA